MLSRLKILGIAFVALCSSMPIQVLADNVVSSVMVSLTNAMGCIASTPIAGSAMLEHEANLTTSFAPILTSGLTSAASEQDLTDAIANAESLAVALAAIAGGNGVGLSTLNTVATAAYGMGYTSVPSALNSQFLTTSSLLAAINVLSTLGVVLKNIGFAQSADSTLISAATSYVDTIRNVVQDSNNNGSVATTDTLNAAVDAVASLAGSLYGFAQAVGADAATLGSIADVVSNTTCAGVRMLSSSNATTATTLAVINSIESLLPALNALVLASLLTTSGLEQVSNAAYNVAYADYYTSCYWRYPASSATFIATTEATQAIATCLTAMAVSSKADNTTYNNITNAVQHMCWAFGNIFWDPHGNSNENFVSQLYLLNALSQLIQPLDSIVTSTYVTASGINSAHYCLNSFIDAISWNSGTIQAEAISALSAPITQVLSHAAAAQAANANCLNSVCDNVNYLAQKMDNCLSHNLSTTTSLQVTRAAVVDLSATLQAVANGNVADSDALAQAANATSTLSQVVADFYAHGSADTTQLTDLASMTSPLALAMASIMANTSTAGQDLGTVYTALQQLVATMSFSNFGAGDRTIIQPLVTGCAGVMTALEAYYLNSNHGGSQDYSAGSYQQYVQGSYYAGSYHAGTGYTDYYGFYHQTTPGYTDPGYYDYSDQTVYTNSFGSDIVTAVSNLNDVVQSSVFTNYATNDDIAAASTALQSALASLNALGSAWSSVTLHNSGATSACAILAGSLTKAHAQDASEEVLRYAQAPQPLSN